MNVFDVYAQYKRDLKKEKKQRELDEKERIAQWKQERKEAKQLREIERKEQLVIEKNLKRMEKIEANKQNELLRKQTKVLKKIEKIEAIKHNEFLQSQAKEEHVRNIINNSYIITADPKDRIQSSVLGLQVNNGFHMNIDSKFIFYILSSIQGISTKKSGVRFFCGMKPK